MVGTLLTAPFALDTFGGAGIPNGLPLGQQVLLQVAAVAVAATWSTVVSLILLKCIERVMPLRVEPDTEVEGLDVRLHNGKAYHL
jgi:Amt family ammonium transporter